MTDSKKEMVDAKKAIQHRNRRVMDLMARGDLEEARAVLRDREWLEGLLIPPTRRRLLVECYDGAIEALTPDSNGHRDMEDARRQCNLVADLMNYWNT